MDLLERKGGEGLDNPETSTVFPFWKAFHGWVKGCSRIPADKKLIVSCCPMISGLFLMWLCSLVPCPDWFLIKKPWNQ
jgi:hypothetical protein